MTSTQVESARTRLQARRKVPEPPPWHPPVLADLAHGERASGWDATLTNCGWIVMEAAPDRVIVHLKGCIKPLTGLQGYLGTWEKARQLDDAIGAILDSRPSLERVLEAPSVGGGSRTESSLIAGMLVRNRDPRLCRVVSATHVSAVLLGDPRVRSAERKRRIRDAVIAFIPEAASRDWNEHMRDAASVVLTHLIDEKKRTQA